MYTGNMNRECEMCRGNLNTERVRKRARTRERAMYTGNLNRERERVRKRARTRERERCIQAI